MKQPTTHRLFYAGALAATLSACVSSGSVPLDDVTSYHGPSPLNPLPLRMPSEEKRLLQERTVDWGLALSGGGLRSALFSFGVLKALYDQELLDEIDVISTVSGGGYTAYWLYANELAAPGQRFGNYSLSDAQFPQRMCELQTTANFVTYPRVLTTISPTVSEKAIRLYETSLRRTFGRRDPAPALTIQSLLPLMDSGRTPLLIQNATIKVDRPWSERLLEITPQGYGSNQLAWVNWSNAAGEKPLTLTKSTAVSGAAFSPLDQQVPLRHPASGQPTMTVTDGGKSENLGAMALIRRGVPNIIISDAEHDPGYIFNAYRQLRFGLQQYGLSLSVPAIENYLMSSRKQPFAQAVASGEVVDAKTRTPVSRIYYIKANLADDLKPVLAEHGDPEGLAATEDAAFRAAMVATRRQGSRDWHCSGLPGSLKLKTDRWAAWSVASYSNWLRRAWKPKFMKLAAGTIGYQGVRIDFPQYSTGDQSFFNDQAEAFFGLGYLQASRLQPVARPMQVSSVNAHLISGHRNSVDTDVSSRPR